MTRHVFHVVVWNSNRVYSAMTVVMVVSLFTAITMVCLHLYVRVFLTSVADIISACCLHPLPCLGLLILQMTLHCFNAKLFFLSAKESFITIISMQNLPMPFLISDIGDRLSQGNLQYCVL